MIRKTEDAIGTSLQGEVVTNYDKLVSVFGEPNTSGDGYKTDVEWVMDIDGEVVTIYNWKDGNNYLGKEGMEIEFITNWHIGGFNKKAVEKVQELLD